MNAEWGLVRLACGQYEVRVANVSDSFDAMFRAEQEANYGPIEFLHDPSHNLDRGSGSVLYVAVSRDRAEAWHRSLASSQLGTILGQETVFCLNSQLVLAIDPFVVSLNLQDGQINWVCDYGPEHFFGLKLLPDHNSMIVHGELHISEISAEGRIIWQASGKDIFTGPFELFSDKIHVTDFDGNIYGIRLDNGHSSIIGRGLPYPHEYRDGCRFALN